MKFTDKDLMKAMGLQVGDRVKIFITDKEFVYDIRLDDKNEPYLFDKKNLIGLIDFRDFIGFDYEILPRPKRVGDLKCGEYGEKKCNSCPIRAICVDDCTDDTLYNKLKLAHKYAKDQEIYDLLKARLDKEVQDNDK